MKDLLIETTLRQHPMHFHTTWGIFSPKKIDEGSRVLLEQIELPECANILDIGCGYGALGLTLAKEAQEVHLVDKDFVAIDCAQKNAAANQLKNTKIYLSNAFSHVPKDVQFDVIVSNLPAKVGKDMLLHIFEEAHKRLKTGGQLYVVSIAGLKEFIKREFKAIFKNYKKLKQEKGYTAALAIKED